MRHLTILAFGDLLDLNLDKLLWGRVAICDPNKTKSEVIKAFDAVSVEIYKDALAGRPPNMKYNSEGVLALPDCPTCGMVLEMIWVHLAEVEQLKRLITKRIHPSLTNTQNGLWQSSSIRIAKP